MFEKISFASSRFNKIAVESQMFELTDKLFDKFNKQSFDTYMYILSELKTEGYITTDFITKMTEYIQSLLQLPWSTFTEQHFHSSIKDMIFQLSGEIYKTSGKGPQYFKNAYTSWITYIKEHTFQGGIGHQFDTTDLPIDRRHHQCLRPEYFEQDKIIPNDVLVACILLKKYIRLSHIAKSELWGN